MDNVDVMVTSLWGHWKRKTGTNTAMKGNEINIINSVEAWLNAGMPPSKINIGFALYGRTSNLGKCQVLGFSKSKSIFSLTQQTQQ